VHQVQGPAAPVAIINKAPGLPSYEKYLKSPKAFQQILPVPSPRWGFGIRGGAFNKNNTQSLVGLMHQGSFGGPGLADVAAGYFFLLEARRTSQGWLTILLTICTLAG
jgi:hypothetical protein